MVNVKWVSVATYIINGLSNEELRKAKQTQRFKTKQLTIITTDNKHSITVTDKTDKTNYGKIPLSFILTVKLLLYFALLMNVSCFFLHKFSF